MLNPKCCLASLSLLATGLYWAGSASTFEYQGFRSGMTLFEAEATAKSQGRPLALVDPDREMYRVGSAFSSMVFGFCDGRLFHMTRHAAGGVDAFASKTKELITLHGESPSVQALSDYTETGLYSLVNLVWHTPDGENHFVTIDSQHEGTRVTVEFGSSAPSVCG